MNAPKIDLLADRRGVRVYKVTMHLPGTGWTLQHLRKGLEHRTIKGWAWILHDADLGTDHVHLVFWTHKEVPPDTLAEWFSVPTPQVQRVRGGKAGIADELRYMLHADESSAALGKVSYPDEAMHAVPGWDWRAFLDAITERRLLAGSPRQRTRTVEQRVADGLPVREALLVGGSTETRLRRLRAAWLVRQPAPRLRVTYYVHGPDRLVVEALARGLAETLAGCPEGVHHVGKNLDTYDGEPVIFWPNATAMVLFEAAGRSIHGALAPLPSPSRMDSRYGITQLVHEHMVLSSTEPFQRFRDSLEMFYRSASSDPRTDSYAHLPVIVPVSADELAVQVNEGVLGTGPFDQYAALGTFRANLHQVIDRARALPDDRRREVELRATRQQVAPVLRASDQVRYALCPQPSTDDSIEALMAEVGAPIEHSVTP